MGTTHTQHSYRTDSPSLLIEWAPHIHTTQLQNRFSLFVNKMGTTYTQQHSYRTDSPSLLIEWAPHIHTTQLQNRFSLFVNSNGHHIYTTAQLQNRFSIFVNRMGTTHTQHSYRTDSPSLLTEWAPHIHNNTATEQILPLC